MHSCFVLVFITPVSSEPISSLFSPPSSIPPLWCSLPLPLCKNKETRLHIHKHTHANSFIAISLSIFVSLFLPFSFLSLGYPSFGFPSLEWFLVAGRQTAVFFFLSPLYVLDAFLVVFLASVGFPPPPPHSLPSPAASTVTTTVTPRTSFVVPLASRCADGCSTREQKRGG